MTTYDRPVEAKLHVHLANGETFEATEEDLKRFGYVDSQATFSLMYHRLISTFQEAGLIDHNYSDVSNFHIAPLITFFTNALRYPDLLDHWENEAMYVEMANVERRLRGWDNAYVPVPTYEEMLAKKQEKDQEIK